jgi:hypothetical protein
MFTYRFSKKLDGDYVDVDRQDGGLYCRVRADDLLQKGPEEAMARLRWSPRMPGWKDVLVALSIARDELLDKKYAPPPRAPFSK